MLRYTIKRVLGMIPTLIIVVTFVFFFVRLIPGDPARLVAGEQATLQDVEAVRERLLELCRERGIFINPLSSIGGVTQSPVNNNGRGGNRSTTISTIQKLCDGLGITI